jgi:hypothetical protein
MLQKTLLLASIAAVTFAFAAPLTAGGDQNAHNNPNGEPSSSTFNPPYTNYDSDGRMMVFCAEDELLVVVPAEGGALEVICQPAD